MHLTEPIIALKAQSRTLQLFNLQTKERLQSFTHPEDIQFWRWISQTTLALVSTRSVYHWDVLAGDQQGPVKVFDRQEQLEVRCNSPSQFTPANNPAEQSNHQLRCQR